MRHFRTHAPLHGLTPTNQIKLFYAGAYSKTTGKKKVKGVPPGAAKALLQLLFLLVQRLESWTHEGPARKQPFQMKLMASHRLYLGELTMSCAVHVMCNTFHVQYTSCMQVACNSVASRLLLAAHIDIPNAHELESDFIMIIIITLDTALDDMTRSHISVGHLLVQAHNLCACLKKPKVQCFLNHTAFL